MSGFARLPLFVQLMLLGSAAMMLPAIVGVGVREFAPARAFFYSGLMFAVLAGLVAIARYRPFRALDAFDQRRQTDREGRDLLLTLVATYLLGPLMLALPFAEATPDTTFDKAWFEMVSALTTTGATLYENPDRLGMAVKFWTALVGWMGGLLAWVAAVAVLAPLNLGGFEVISARQPGQGNTGVSQITRVAAGSERVSRFAARLFPVYLALTLALWFALAMTGNSPFVALCHAMSVMATSGISPVGGLGQGGAGFVGELVVFAFLALAISRKTFTSETPRLDAPPLWRDAEVRIAATILILVPLLLFLRHWGGVIEVQGEFGLGRALASFWGGLFMVMSFLTTAGFESASWEAARAWSGLQAPGVLLMGLAIFGGGVATTAGGVKLLRLYALVRHSEREIEKLISPSSVGGAGAEARRVRRDGAYVAWVYFMVFAFTIAGVMMLLSLFGHDFESSTIFTLSALTTTGPLVHVAGEVPLSFADLGGWERLILAATMVLGRMELLAIIALLNPEFWRR